MNELVALEEQGWQALSSNEGAGTAFYDSVLRDDAMMLFSGGMRLDGKEQILASLAAQPWESFQMSNVKAISLSEDTGAVIYDVAARREGRLYKALISSTYTFADGVWKLAIHQQTLAQ